MSRALRRPGRRRAKLHPPQHEQPPGPGEEEQRREHVPEPASAAELPGPKGDQDAKYSSIMSAMDDLRKVGIEDIGLITERRKAQGTAGGK